MTIKQPPHSLRPNWATLGMRLLALMVIMIGTAFSSIGGTNSHGLAEITASIHVAPPSPDGTYEYDHAHKSSESTVLKQSAANDHSHHVSDHSHDKAHALPAAWSSTAPQLPDRVGRVRPWLELVQASRLERPPMG